MKNKGKNARKIILWSAVGLAAAASLGVVGAYAAKLKADQDAANAAKMKATVDQDAAVIAFPRICQSNSAPTRLDVFFDKEVFGKAPDGYNWRASVLPDGTFEDNGEDYIVPASGFGNVFPDIPAYLEANSAANSSLTDALCYFDLAKFARLQWPSAAQKLITGTVAANPGCVQFAIKYQFGAFSSAFTPLWRGGIIGVGFPAAQGDYPTVQYADVYGGALDDIYAKEGN